MSMMLGLWSPGIATGLFVAAVQSQSDNRQSLRFRMSSPDVSVIERRIGRCFVEIFFGLILEKSSAVITAHKQVWQLDQWALRKMASKSAGCWASAGRRTQLTGGLDEPFALDDFSTRKTSLMSGRNFTTVVPDDWIRLVRGSSIICSCHLGCDSIAFPRLAEREISSKSACTGQFLHAKRFEG